VTSWSESQVLGWLQQQGPPLSSFVDVMSSNNIDGPTLSSMSESDLDAIGVNNFRARRQIHSSIQALLGSGSVVRDVAHPGHFLNLAFSMYKRRF
jgi:hypothetical protein